LEWPDHKGEAVPGGVCIVQRLPVFAAIGLILVMFAGCVAPGDDDHSEGPAVGPALEITLEQETILRDMGLVVHVAFENTLGHALPVDSAQDCLGLEVYTRTADGTAIPFEVPGPGDCAFGSTRLTIEPGARIEWGPIRFVPGEWEQGGRPMFTPGEYTVYADFLGTTSWDSAAQADYTIVPGELPMIEILPEKAEWVQGETTRITVRLVNTSPVAFHFTSPNGCKDIEVRTHLTHHTEADGWQDARLWPADGPYACTEVITEFTLEVGEEIIDEVVWDGSRDGQGGPPYVEGQQFLKASLGAIESDWNVSSDKQVRILPEEDP
jgi:hypothetical protein